MNFGKPNASEYAKIAELVNQADKIYKNIYSEKEFEDRGIGKETSEGLVKGGKIKEYICAYEEDNRILGFASYYLKNPQTVWISMLYVDADLQKSGIGSKLIKEVENISKIKNALVIVLETDKNANWSVNFYKKNDYIILSDDDLLIFPFDKVLDKKQAKGRYIFGKILDKNGKLANL